MASENRELKNILIDGRIHHVHQRSTIRHINYKVKYDIVILLNYALHSL